MRDQLKKKTYDSKRYATLKSNNDSFLSEMAERKRMWRKKNSTKNSDIQKRWKFEHPDQVKMIGRDYNYRKKYNITLDDYNNLLLLQDGKCLLCGNTSAYKTKSRNLFVDHNHVNGKIRGLLCSKCNTCVGVVELIGLENIIKYLQ